MTTDGKWHLIEKLKGYGLWAREIETGELIYLAVKDGEKPNDATKGGYYLMMSALKQKGLTI